MKVGGRGVVEMKLFLLAVRFRPDRKHTVSPLPMQRLFYITHTCIFLQSVYQLTNALNKVHGGSNMTGTDLCVNKPHCAAAVRP